MSAWAFLTRFAELYGAPLDAIRQATVDTVAFLSHAGPSQSSGSTSASAAAARGIVLGLGRRLLLFLLFLLLVLVIFLSLPPLAWRALLCARRALAPRRPAARRAGTAIVVPLLAVRAVVGATIVAVLIGRGRRIVDLGVLCARARNEHVWAHFD
jgi:hypothetical protein